MAPGSIAESRWFSVGKVSKQLNSSQRHRVRIGKTQVSYRGLEERRDHGRAALQLHLGQLFSLMRDFAMEEIPESVAELFDDANGDLAVGDLPAAVEKYRKCTEIEPTFFDGWHALGMALMKNGQYPEAIEAGNKAVELRPNDQLAWSSLSLFYVRNNQIKEAEAASGKARILSWGGKIVRDTKE